MASVQIRTKRGEYYAFFLDGTGKRTCRNTGTKKKREAQRIANLWEREATKDKHQTVAAPVREVEHRLIETSATFTKSSPFKSLTWPSPKSWTASSKANRNRKSITWKISDSDQKERSLRGSADALSYSQKAGSITSTGNVPSDLANTLNRILEKRWPQMESAVRRVAEDRSKQALFEDFLKQHEIEQESILFPSQKEHQELLEKVWADFIRRKEPGAWGEMWVEDNKDIKWRCLGEMRIHDFTPHWPNSIMRPHSIAVIIRWAVNNFTDVDLEIETESAASATVILEGLLFKDGLPPDHDPLILDGPFCLLDKMESDAEMVLLSNETGDDDNLPQRTIASEVITGVSLARQKLWHALKTNHPAQSSYSQAGWLQAIGFCMLLADRAREMGSVIPRSSERKAVSARKLIQTQKRGGHPHSKRQEIVEKLAGFLAENPSKPLNFALKRLGIRETTEKGVFLVEGLGERKLSALREMWTEARELVQPKKHSETGPTPNPKGSTDVDIAE